MDRHTAGSSGPLAVAALTNEGIRCASNLDFLADALVSFDSGIHRARPDLDAPTTFKHLLMPVGLPG